MNIDKLYLDQTDQFSLNLAKTQLSILRQHGFAYFFIHIVLASLLCSSIWLITGANSVLIVIWYFAVILVVLGRWQYSLNFLGKSHLNHLMFVRTTNNFRYFSLFLTAIWGLSGIILFSEALLIHALHLICLMAVAVTTLPSSIISRTDFHIQIAFVFLPISFMLLIQDNFESRFLGATALGFAAGLIMVGHIFGEMLEKLYDSQLELMEQVQTDPVTQLINRSHFDQIFKNEWRRSARQENPISLLLIDIDNFQALEIFNSSHTDQYLRTITLCLKSAARRGSDILSRFGRSEFVVLLPDTNSEAAMSLAIRIRDEVERAQLEYVTNTKHILSVSIGVSSCNPNVRLSEQEGKHPRIDNADLIYPAMLLSGAGKALERAKSIGSNRIEFSACGDGIEGVATVFRHKPNFHPDKEPR